MPTATDLLSLLSADVEVGMFVHLDIGWTNHPFPFNSFRIRDEQQLARLKALGLERVHVDPLRSEPAMRPRFAALAARALATAAPSPDVPADGAAEPPPDVAAAIAAKRERIERLERQREAMDECERRYLSATRTLSSINGNLFADREASVARAKKFVAGLVDSLDRFAEVHVHLMNNKLSNKEVYDHAMNVASLSLVLGRRMGLSPEELVDLGLGCLFHDLGKGEISEKVARKGGPLTQFEREVLMMHVDHGVNLARKLGLPEAAIEVISQHHETMDGSGFPRGLAGHAIGKLAKVAALVNAFDNHCNPPNAPTGITPHEALKRMFARERDRHDPDTLSAFIRTMGIYPPGTLVRLNDGNVGLVLAVNVAHALRPTVLVYEPGVPRREAIVLELAAQPDFTIEQAIQREDLSIEAAAFLNPRRRVAYFAGDA